MQEWNKPFDSYTQIDLLVKAMAVVVCLQAIGPQVLRTWKWSQKWRKTWLFSFSLGVAPPSALTSSMVCSDAYECLHAHFLVSDVIQAEKWAFWRQLWIRWTSRKRHLCLLKSHHDSYSLLAVWFWACLFPWVSLSVWNLPTSLSWKSY